MRVFNCIYHHICCSTVQLIYHCTLPISNHFKSLQTGQFKYSKNILTSSKKNQLFHKNVFFFAKTLASVFFQSIFTFKIGVTFLFGAQLRWVDYFSVSPIAIFSQQATLSLLLLEWTVLQLQLIFLAISTSVFHFQRMVGISLQVKMTVWWLMDKVSALILCACLSVPETQSLSLAASSFHVVLTKPLFLLLLIMKS